MDINAAEISKVIKDQIANFGTEAEVEKMWQAVAASPYLERMAMTPGGPALYRLR